MAKFTPANLPAEFLDTMRDIMPSSLSMADFIAACQRPLRRSIRVNTLKISVEAFLRLVQPYGWQLEPIPWCQEGFWLLNAEEENMRLGNTLEHLSGLFYIQEASSMLPVSALFHRNEALETVLDVAAAPGSKTTQIAARLDNKGAIVANEYSASRVKVLHANISRCGVSNTAMTHFDGRVFGAALPEYFDAILLDAPCSGEGVVRKDPAAMSLWSRESITEIAATQRDLILSAFHALKPGGVMIYSTCTLNKQENQQVCHWLQAQFPDACEFESLRDLFTDAERATTEDGFLHVFPQIYDSEGFFVARLRKTASVPPLPRPGYKVGKFPFSPVAPKDCVPLIQAARKQGIHWDETLLQLWQRDSEIWLFPAALTSAFGNIKFSRIGIKLAERFPKGFRWQHEAIVALADPNANNAYALTDDIACEWFQGKDCYPEPLPTADELILTYQNTPVGLAKRINSRIKNSLPRDLVRDGASSAQQRAKE
ncbi:16S rRNA (cytosine(1407)-C(5))-methyltransferase RsmF [Pectobacterium aroidearum]|uniref:16S rRNA (cytosine(1407)-C(5))-methyltransferase RsmF n=1 Tax=Pectobacterium aroidearum TaxID=1201031 RepID=UPI002114C854|nr:16S rRNA (cytosine(1407)-C(5))-methyltransferase RsmF [Pectobacterium aroidearum]UUE59415.1 16S rRNA (cytosine(1407)-C(5))-methyltransferase RsmF [Pectobacterium aroidearum]UUE72242.1 16S rRNA (cytosine(1407)-C(5))-methyltransferase RsmF [Pectobacterium aroidearum]UUE76642.1 16S rRNA (cytosine(1407)-C(5))-methyltransferase RsmF [Pectobacterium aroidearum]UUE80866.1 16S rRNA (cytosine(1407)-C(5))-methyltransferase RsmF [Pectobacterium aroidearum]